MAAFKAWRADASQFLPVARDIAHGHGLPTASPHIFSTGTISSSVSAAT